MSRTERKTELHLATSLVESQIPNAGKGKLADTISSSRPLLAGVRQGAESYALDDSLGWY